MIKRCISLSEESFKIIMHLSNTNIGFPNPRHARHLRQVRELSQEDMIWKFHDLLTCVLLFLTTGWGSFK